MSIPRSCGPPSVDGDPDVDRQAAGGRHETGNAEVAAIYPPIAVVPENLLRMYVEFSAPMGSRKAGEFVRLLDRTSGTDTVVDEAFLPVEADFWSPDHKRYTLFLDPGRVKRGILPNRERGRPLRAGHAYALAISAEWPDEHGQPLKAAFRHEFTAGPAVASGIDASAWRITPPAPGTRDRLVVEFDRALDHAVAARALGVERDGLTSRRQRDRRTRRHALGVRAASGMAARRLPADRAAVSRRSARQSNRPRVRGRRRYAARTESGAVSHPVRSGAVTIVMAVSKRRGVRRCRRT